MCVCFVCASVAILVIWCWYFESYYILNCVFVGENFDYAFCRVIVVIFLVMALSLTELSE